MPGTSSLKIKASFLHSDVVEEMIEARDRVRAGHKVKTDEHKRGWQRLHVGDIVRGHHPKTKE